MDIMFVEWIAYFNQCIVTNQLLIGFIDLKEYEW